MTTNWLELTENAEAVHSLSLAAASISATGVNLPALQVLFGQAPDLAQALTQGW